MKDRIQHIDIVAGIMILWMIFQHALQSAWGIDHNFTLRGEAYNNPNLWFPYLNYFMPWFFYKSGSFFTKINKKDLLKKDINKFLKTFIIWSAIGYVFYLIFGLYDQTLTLHNAVRTLTTRFFLYEYVEINRPLWFLLSLFAVKSIANAIFPKSNDLYFVHKCLGICVLLVLVAALIQKSSILIKPVWAANITTGLVFFTLGYLMTGYERKSWLIILCVFGVLTSCIFGWNIVCMYDNVLMKGSYLLWFPNALCGIVVVNNVCRMLREWTDKITPPPQYSHRGLFETIGKYAMPIYVTHSFVRYPIHTILVHTNNFLPWGWTLTIICAGYALFLPPICILWRKYSKI